MSVYNADLETLMDALTGRIEDLRDELADAEKALAEAEDRLISCASDAAPEDFLPYDSSVARRLARVIDHLLHATGVYDLTDLKDAALDAGLELEG
ncbi:hypothetical protein E0686_02475 [Deinococcus sp. S9]|nr:hypothetical protein E0686_02475 [Deinococcus sp. S9]